MHISRNGFCTFRCLNWLGKFVVFTTLCCCSGTTLAAGTLALPDGQAYLPGQFNTINLDVAGIADTEEQRVGARFSFPRFSDHFIVFLEAQSAKTSSDDIALGSEVDLSGGGSGGGIYITDLPHWNKYSVNLRFSVFNEELDVDSNIVSGGVQAQTTIETRSIGLALLLSPVKPFFKNGANAYLTLGARYHQSERTVVLNGQSEQSLFRSEDDVRPHLALGLVYPYKRISVYASMEYEQSLAVGLGVRVQLSREGIY